MMGSKKVKYNVIRLTQNKWAQRVNNSEEGNVNADVEESSGGYSMKMVKQGVLWPAVQECLNKNDTAKLNKLIDFHGFRAVFRPEEAPSLQTIIHGAVELTETTCLDFILNHQKAKDLIQREKDFSFDIPDYNGCSPVFNCVQVGNLAALKQLCGKGFEINARKNTGENVLHFVVRTLKNAEIKNEVINNVFDCLTYLLDDTNIDIEAHNSDGITPLIVAAHEIPQNKENIVFSRLINFCNKLISKGANINRLCNVNLSANTIFTQKNILSHITSSKNIEYDRPFISQFADAIIKGNEDIDNVLRGKTSEEKRRVVNTLIGINTPLYRATDKCCMKTMKSLIEAGANPWIEQPFGQLCLHIALARGSHESIDLLINIMKKQKGTSQIDLQMYSYELFEVFLTNSKDENSVEYKYYIDSLKRLLHNDVVLDLNRREDQTSQSIIHLAAEFHNQDVLQLLIENGAFIGHRKSAHKNEFSQVLDALNTHTFENAMGNCISYYKTDEDTCGAKSMKFSENIIGEKHTLNLNYNFLVPSSDELKKFNEVRTLRDIGLNKKHKYALTHPLLQTFIYAKWRRIMPLFIINLFIYALFALFLTCFMYSLTDLRVIEKEIANITSQSEATFDSLYDDIETRNDSSILKLKTRYDNKYIETKVFMCLLIPLALYMFLREIFQIIFTFTTYRKKYIENGLEMLIIVVPFIMMIFEFDVKWTTHIAAWEMIFAWYSFIFILGRSPAFALYISMLINVSREFLKLLCLFSALIIAFSIGFNILLMQTTVEEGDNAFSSIWTTIPRAMVMATGEFEYTNLNAQFFNAEAYFTASAFLIFVVFLFVIFLVLNNVMNGLAVKDTKEIHDNATIYSLQSRLDLIYLIEEMLLSSPRLRRVLHKVFNIRSKLIAGFKLPRLLARVNHPKKGKRIVFGDNNENCRLNTTISDLLRAYRLEQIQQKEKEMKPSTMDECLVLLTEIKKMLSSNRTNTPGN